MGIEEFTERNFPPSEAGDKFHVCHYDSHFCCHHVVIIIPCKNHLFNCSHLILMTIKGGRVEGHPDDRAGWQGVQADQGDAHPQGLQGDQTQM